MHNLSAMKRVAMFAGGCAVAGAAGVLIVLLFMFRDTSLSRLREKGCICIGYALEAPYAFLSPEGEVTGESPEVARRIVARLGIDHIIWRQAEFGALIDELEAGRIDVIAAGMFITMERAKRVSFSEPTFHVRQGLLIPRGNPRQLHSYRQAVKNTDIRIAVLDGSVEERFMRRLGLPDARLKAVPDALTGRMAVETGIADCLALSAPTVHWMFLQHQLGRLEPAFPFEQTGDEASGLGAFAFRKKDRRLLTAWNAELNSFIATPEHLALVAEFGFTREELPGKAMRMEADSE